VGDIEPWIRDLPPAARGRMLAVRRTAEWERSGKDVVRFLGVNCLRLLDEALAQPALPDSAREALADGRVLLDGIVTRRFILQKARHHPLTGSDYL